MRILLVGTAGTAGSAIHDALTARGHDVVTVGRTSGDLRFDVADLSQHDALWAAVGPVDAVVSAIGTVPYAPVDELSPDDFQAAFTGKVLAQIGLVLSGLPHVAERGSFTLISGITARDPIVTAAPAAMANGALEAFVRSAAIEIAPRRINVVSPSVFTESLEHYGDAFPGFPAVDLADVARAFVKAIEGAATGQVLTLP